MESINKNKIEKIETFELVKPSAKYKDSYIAAAKEEFQIYAKDFNVKNKIVEDKIKETEEHFDEFINKFNNLEKGINLSDSDNSELWLIDNEEFIGRVLIQQKPSTEPVSQFSGNIDYTIRPSKRGLGYGSQALRLGLIKAKELGLDNVLITCDDDNIGSSKIIEKNNGILENKIEMNGKLIRRYWINLD